MTNEPVIRILNEQSDAELLREAWAWAETMPDWFKEVQAEHKETLNDFLDAAKDELIIGVFTECGLSAVIRFVPQMAGLYELHLMAKRGTDFEVLLNACQSIKFYVFDHGFRHLGGWAAEKNRPVVRLYRQLGFSQSADFKMQGTIHGKTAKWLFFEAKKG